MRNVDFEGASFVIKAKHPADPGKDSTVLSLLSVAFSDRGLD